MLNALKKWVGKPSANPTLSQKEPSYSARPSLFNAKTDPKDVKRGEFNINYNPALIPSLVDDHALLVNLVSEIGHFAEIRSYSVMKKKIRELHHELNRHILVEDLRFYGFFKKLELENTQLADCEDRPSVKEMQNSMRGIAKAANEFLKEMMSDGFEFNDETIGYFSLRFNEIVRVLSKRIETEELSLYPLYDDIGRGKL